MGNKTLIKWTEATWNPVTGCSKVSEGCDHCYAERITNRFGGPGAFDTVVLHPERLDAPLRRRKPTTWFVNSMSDLFHDDVPDEFIAHVWDIMASTPRHTYQILTKRPGRMSSFLRAQEDTITRFNLGPAPLPNVWLGTSVETQKWADVRIPKLLETPAAVRFLSCEPLLGPVDLSAFPGGSRHSGRCAERFYIAAQIGEPFHCDCGPGIDWVICGGESGPDARPMHPDWARSLRDQCVAAGVAWFFKQWGEWAPGQTEEIRQAPWVMVHRETGEMVKPFDRPEVLEAARAGHTGLMYRLGKKRAGRELDGRMWDEMPEQAT